MAPGSVTFTMTSANTDPSDSAWNFGDGTPEVWNQGQVQHTYTAAGAYQVTLTAWDLVCGTWRGADPLPITVVGDGGGGPCPESCKLPEPQEQCPAQCLRKE